MFSLLGAAFLGLVLGGTTEGASGQQRPAQNTGTHGQSGVLTDWWGWPATIVTGLAATFALDETVRELVANPQGRHGRGLTGLGNDYGDWEKTAPWLLGGSAAIGLLLEQATGAKKVAAGTLGVFAGSMANVALNRLIGRSRPFEEMGAWHFDPGRSNAALGSGHAAYTFAIAAAIDELVEGPWAIPFYLAAGGTAAARVRSDRHWLSDVVFGGLVGYLGGGAATRMATRWMGLEGTGSEVSSEADRHVTVMPVGGLGSAGTVGLVISVSVWNP